MSCLWRYASALSIRSFWLLLISLLVPSVQAVGLPDCKQIFTDPASGQHPNALQIPADLSSRGNISCHLLSSCPSSFPEEFDAGDYRYSNGAFTGISTLEPDEGTVRLYFDNLSLDASWFNVDYGYGDAADVVIYVKNRLTMKHGSKIHGIVYVGGEADIDVTSEITGALATGEVLDPWWIGRVDVDLDAVEQADMTPMCPSKEKATLPLQFGQASEPGVTFTRPFPPGSRPLVFLMPSISPNNANRATPASAFLTSVDRYGFSYSSQVAPGSGGSARVTPVNWVAVLPGRYWIDTPTGKKLLVAGSSQVDFANRPSKRAKFESVALTPGLTTVLTQIQTDNNYCWLTSLGFRPSANSGELLLGMESSGANRGGKCYPGGANLNHLRNEQVGYLAMAPGVGTLVTADGDIRYQSGHGNTSAGSREQSLAQQCRYDSPLAANWFDEAPTLVASINSRTGGDGGWPRLCQISESDASVVIDETEYLDRQHLPEAFGFLALEKQKAPDMECLPIDTFSRNTLGDNWVSAKLPGSASPSITNGRLVITQKKGDQAASLTYRYLFPADANAIRVSFDYYAWHQGNSRGGDGMAVVFSDAAQSPAPGGFGGALGYAQRQRDGKQFPGFHGGWLGVALDSWGNYSSPEGGKVGGPGSRANSIALRGAAATGYAYIGGAPGNNQSTAQLNPPLEQANSYYPGPGDHYSFLLDTRLPDSNYVSVARTLAANGHQQQVISNMDINSLTGQSKRPRDFYISLTGSTGQAFNEHAIDNFQVCAIKSQPVQEEIHHFEFEYSGSPLACAPLAVTVKACSNADCSELYTDEVTADLTPRNADSVTWLNASQQPLGSNTVRFSGGQMRLYLKQTSAAPQDVVTLGISNSSPSTMPYSQTLCYGGDGSRSCSLNFAEAGFVLDDVETYAGRPVTMRIKAVKQADNSLQCQPTFANQTKPLTLSVDYRNPRQPVVINTMDELILSQSGNKVAAIPKGSAQAVTANIKFDRQGIANLTLSYPDAGWLNLNAQYQGRGQDKGLLMYSSNGNVRSVPAGFCVTPEPKAVCSAANPTACSPYKRAGEGFDLALSARGWQGDGDKSFCDNPLTPSFSMANIALGSELVAPAGGHQGVVSVKQQDMSLGRSTEFTQAVDEVGVFRFSAANPKTSDGRTQYYLDAGLPIATGYSQPLGRFVPASFRVSDAVLMPGCNAGFSYMAQPFNLGFEATALNLQHRQTYNYTAGFAKAGALLKAENADNGVDLSSRLSTLPPLSWQYGKAKVDTSQSVIFARPQAPQVDGPFEKLAIGVLLDDNDAGMASMAGADMNASVQGDCQSLGCDAVTLGSQKLRFGRIRMDNVYGPDSANLTMPVYAEYWNGNRWQVNSSDQCTSLTNVALQPGTTVYKPAIASGQHVTRELPAEQSHFWDGKLQLVWHNHFDPRAAVDHRYYRGEINAPLAVPAWMQFYWGWHNADPLQSSDPRASAFFGRYRGDDKVIYWHERN